MIWLAMWIKVVIALDALPGRRRGGDGDGITRAYGIRYHGGVAMIAHVADVERLIGHHAIDEIARAHGAEALVD
ncbi:hypothetical protein [Streptomyces sp. NPDC003006]